MARTTLVKVNKIIQYDSINVPDPQQQIDDASLMVDNIIGDAVGAPTAELIERFLSGHLIAISDARIASEQVKSIQASYQYKLSDGLGITHYGATAMLLDTSKKLAIWNKQVINGTAKPQFFWAGTDNS